jgi:membrane protein implicated in regulation of membrane protease activity
MKRSDGMFVRGFVFLALGVAAGAVALAQLHWAAGVGFAALALIGFGIGYIGAASDVADGEERTQKRERTP